VTFAVPSTLTNGVPVAENGVGWRELSPRSAAEHRLDMVEGAVAAEPDLCSLGQRAGGKAFAVVSLPKHVSIEGRYSSALNLGFNIAYCLIKG